MVKLIYAFIRDHKTTFERSDSLDFNEPPINIFLIGD